MRARAFRARPALELRGAALAPGAPPLDLRLDEGEIVWLCLGEAGTSGRLLDLASGLLAPAAGAVRALGLDWRALGARQAAALRGRIGRLLPAGAWVPHLSIAENVALRPLHHTDRSRAALLDEAAALCRHFGLAGAPLDAPGDVSRETLQRATLARMFIDAPALLLIDETAEPIPGPLVAPTANSALAAVRSGAAALWITDANHNEGPALMAEARRLRLGRDGIVAAGREVFA